MGKEKEGAGTRKRQEEARKAEERKLKEIKEQKRLEKEERGC